MPGLWVAFRGRSTCGFLLVLGILSFGTGLCADEQAEKYVLRYRFDEGASVFYSVRNQSRIEVQQGPSIQHVEHEEVTEKHYTVVSTDADGNATLELTIDHVQMSAAVDGAPPVTFDSRTADEPPAPFIGVAQTIGQPLARIEASPTGELLSIEWLVESGNGPLPDAKNAANLDILLRLPDQPVAINEIWKERFETEVAIDQKLRKNITLMRTYRLTEVKDGRATIELKTSIITPLQDPDIEAQLIQKTPQGTIQFDLERGLMLSRTINVDKEVVGFNDGKSRIHTVTTRREQLQEDGVATGPTDPIGTAQESSTPAR